MSPPSRMVRSNYPAGDNDNDDTDHWNASPSSSSSADARFQTLDGTKPGMPRVDNDRFNRFDPRSPTNTGFTALVDDMGACCTRDNNANDDDDLILPSQPSLWPSPPPSPASPGPAPQPPWPSPPQSPSPPLSLSLSPSPPPSPTSSSCTVPIWHSPPTLHSADDGHGEEEGDGQDSRALPTWSSPRSRCVSERYGYGDVGEPEEGLRSPPYEPSLSWNSPPSTSPAPPARPQSPSHKDIMVDSLPSSMHAEASRARPVSDMSDRALDNFYDEWIDEADRWILANQVKCKNDVREDPQSPRRRPFTRRNAISMSEKPPLRTREPYTAPLQARLRLPTDSDDSEGPEFGDIPGQLAARPTRKRKAFDDGRASVSVKRRETSSPRRTGLPRCLNRFMLERMMEFLPKSLPLGTWDRMAQAMMESEDRRLNNYSSRHPEDTAMDILHFDGRQLQSFWYGALTDWVKKIAKY